MVVSRATEIGKVAVSTAGNARQLTKDPPGGDFGGISCVSADNKRVGNVPKWGLALPR